MFGADLYVHVRMQACCAYGQSSVHVRVGLRVCVCVFVCVCAPACACVCVRVFASVESEYRKGMLITVGDHRYDQDNIWRATGGAAARPLASQVLVHRFHHFRLLRGTV